VQLQSVLLMMTVLLHHMLIKGQLMMILVKINHLVLNQILMIKQLEKLSKKVPNNLGISSESSLWVVSTQRVVSVKSHNMLYRYDFTFD